MVRVFIVICSFATACAVGCQRDSSSETSSAQTARLVNRIDDLERRVETLQLQIETNDLMKDLDRIAYLTPGQRGHSTVLVDLGSLTIQIDDVKSYANGSKITIRLGNPLAATINGLKAKLEWGAVGADGKPDNITTKSKDIALNETMQPGTWTRSDVVLEGIKPEALGFVRVRDIGHQGVVLRGR